MDAITAYSLTKVAFGGTAANVRPFFPWMEVLKLFKSLTVGQAVPEIPLSVGRKLELLRAFVFAKFPYISRTLTHLSAYAYCRVYVYFILHCT